MRNHRYDAPLTDVDLQFSAWCRKRDITAVFGDFGQREMYLERWVDGKLYGSGLDTTDDDSPELWAQREKQLRKIHADLLKHHRVSDRQRR